MPALKVLALAGLSVLGAVSALQDSLQRPLVNVTHAPAIKPKPLVDSEALQASISGDKLLARAEELYEIAKLGEDEYNHPTRVIGSEGHLGTLGYIYTALARLGDYYTLSKQLFPAVTGNVFEFRLVLGHDVPESAQAMGLTPATKARQPERGDLLLVANDGCNPDDYPPTARGKILLIKRGSCSFGAKSERAGHAGAIAAVIYNSDRGPLSGTLGDPSAFHVATFGLSGDDAAPVVAKLQSGARVDASAYIDATVDRITTTNIIAQTTAGDPDHCVMLGGHSDSVAEGPGINDDGSGTLALLEVATQLAGFAVHNCVRFAWWSAEEEGLLGSDYYVAALTPRENRRIRVFMDYDMLASPNFAYQVYDARNDANPVGSQELRDLYVDWYAAQGLNHTFIAFDGRSDYDAFIRNGIPGGGIATGAEGLKTEAEAGVFGGTAGLEYDPCYHQLCDDVANLNATAWELNTKLVAHSVATFARSFEGFPERTDEGIQVAKRGAYSRKTKYRGSKLFI
ncbi:Zn-dependent exopeptidase [Trichocladium antarcticum]|uniref:Peptide hydrolase n=1 Tax=Trichocladium antarcticum TaxID=1450529 RepID=A0AAN6ZE45_9PEZI|nr:Zn-dependent exopeptidase [Trichocladium antarcticum]